MPTSKELEQIQKAQSTLKEILKVHMREPIDDPEFDALFNNMKKLKKNGCDLFWTEDITLSIQNEKGKLLGQMMSDGYITLTAPQIGIRILYVKVYGGKGMLWGKKIHYAVYQQDYDEKTWTPLGTFKIWGLAVTGINNIFRSEGLLQGSAL
tara:strand:+ start:394 stop:849 length:456 start_codon:yes stop_codon:yes gene_type:complete